MEIHKIKKDSSVPRLEKNLEYDWNGSAVDLTGATVYFNMGNLTDYTAYHSGVCGITDRNTGSVYFEWDAISTGSIGTFWGEFEVDWGSGSIMTIPNEHDLQIEVYEDYN